MWFPLKPFIFFWLKIRFSSKCDLKKKCLFCEDFVFMELLLLAGFQFADEKIVMLCLGLRF